MRTNLHSPDSECKARQIRLQVLVNGVEARQIRRAAELAGVSVSALLRRLGLSVADGLDLAPRPAGVRHARGPG